MVTIVTSIRSSRSAKAGRRISEGSAEFARRSRRDEIVRQLREEGDSTQLRLLVNEGRLVAQGCREERIAVEKAYYSNPMSPLPIGTTRILGVDREGRREVVTAMIDSLESRWPSEGEFRANVASSMAGLTRVATDLDLESRRPKIAELLIRRSGCGQGVTASAIRSIIAGGPESFSGPNPEAAADYISAVSRGRFARDQVVNVVGGVSLGVVDLCGGHRVGLAPNFANLYVAYILLMRGSFTRPGGWDEEIGMTISPEYAASAMMDALGCLARNDAYLNTTCMKSLIGVLESIPRSLISDASAESIDRWLRSLLQVEAREDLKSRLRTVVDHLVGHCE
ncbi:hypothetical protein [Pseudonocardia phyllosphaerae]|uniref:hypothetical protein n=1 Tax=Pseudonocardia phyllosphaerae TaxID=3390502 RepID=UPI00397DA698